MDAPQPAPQPKKRGLFKPLGIGCLGLIGLLVLLAIVGALTSGGDKATPPPRPQAVAAAPTVASQAPTTTSATTVPTAAQPSAVKPSPTPAPQPTPTSLAYAWGTNKEDVHVQLAENASAEIPAPGSKGIHKVTVLKITDNAKSSNQFESAGDGKKFWLVEVQLENTGTAEIHGGTWKLRTSDDFELDPAFAVGFGDSFNTLQSLTPGAKTKGTVVFAVAEGATPKFLRYDPNVFMKGDLYFDGQSPLKS